MRPMGGPGPLMGRAKFGLRSLVLFGRPANVQLNLKTRVGLFLPYCLLLEC